MDGAGRRSRRHIWVTLATITAFVAGSAVVTAAFVRGGPWDRPPPRLDWVQSATLPATSVRAWYDIACPAPHECWAAGAAVPGADAAPALLGHVTGEAWQTVPISGDAELIGRITALTAIGCASTVDCWALGDLDGTAALLHYDGEIWQADATFDLPLADLSCAPRGPCYAVGHTLDGGGAPVPVVARLDASGWVLVDAGTTVTGLLTTVSCPARDTCWALGLRAGGALLVSVGRDEWQTEPVDGAVAAALDGSRDAGLACARADLCWVLGGGATDTVVLRGGDWAVVPAGTYPGPPNADRERWLGFGCRSDRFCWAVGERRPDVVTAEPAVYFFDGESWSRQLLPAARGSGLNALACASRHRCWAVGYGPLGEPRAFLGT